MKRIPVVILLGTAFMQTNPAQAYPEGFAEYIYRGQHSFNPFTGRVDGNVVDFQLYCHFKGFPIIDKAAVCTANGKLAINKDLTSIEEGRITEVEGKITGLFALREKDKMLLKLNDIKRRKPSDCEIPDTYTLPLDDDPDNERLRTVVNSLIFKHRLKLTLQGCAHGRPVITGFEVMNCTRGKCRDSLQTPLSIPQQINIRD